VRELAPSRLTQKEFCARTGVDRGTFREWRRVVEAEAGPKVEGSACAWAMLSLPPSCRVWLSTTSRCARTGPGTGRSRPARGEDRERALRVLPGSRAAMDAFKVRLDEEQPRHLPKSPMAKAIADTLNNWSELTVFLDNHGVPPDNSASEPP